MRLSRRLSDEHWGRRVHAVVQARNLVCPPAPDALIQFARAKLAGYKVPKTVEFVDEIPRTAATKGPAWDWLRNNTTQLNTKFSGIRAI